MAPVQPHSAQRKARSCESCHNNPKAVGYGIGGGEFQNRYALPLDVDLKDQRSGELLVAQKQTQIAAIPNLDFDLSQIVDPEDGRQLATVGTHWPLSRAFSREEIDGILRVGLCMGCHREMPKRESVGRGVRARAAVRIRPYQIDEQNVSRLPPRTNALAAQVSRRLRRARIC